MYPHALDLHRLFSAIFTALLDRTQTGRAQKDMAAGLGVNQADISKLRDLEASKVRRRTPVKLDNLLSILQLGLNLEPRETAAMLQLYEADSSAAGRPMSRRQSLPDQCDPRAYQQDDLWLIVLGLLERATTARETYYEASARILFQRGEGSRLMGAQNLLRMEKEEEGVLLLMLAHLSIFSCPPATVRGPQIKSKDVQKEWEVIQHQRRMEVMRQADTYGLRSIHTKGALQEYFCGAVDDYHPAHPAGNRREDLEYLITLLGKHPYFEIRLVDHVPPIEYEIKSTKSVVLRGATRPTDPNQLGVGIRHLYFTDRFSVLSFMWDFERQWNQIPLSGRGVAVSSFLRDLRSSIA